MFEYRLSNGTRIDYEGVIDALGDINSDHQYFLDTKSGEVGFVNVPAGGKKKAQALAKNKRYIKIPKIADSVQQKWLKEFVTEMLTETTVDKKLGKKILDVLDRTSAFAFEECLGILEQGQNGWIHSWAEWQGTNLFEEMKNWFATLPFPVEEKFVADCDCELCKLMENGEPTMGAVMEAMQKEQRKGAVVGGMGLSEFEHTFDEHNKDDYYYDAMDLLQKGLTDKALSVLMQAYTIDRNCIQTQLGIAEVHYKKGDKENTVKWINSAYKKVLQKFSPWPKMLPWEELDNRAVLRVIAHKADSLLDDDKKDEAIELYRRLLILNPNDNQGIRYLLAGVYEGLSGEDTNRMFDEGNQKQNWDALERLVARQNKLHTFWKKPKD